MRLVGESHPNSKLTNNDVLKIRELGKMGFSRKIIAHNFKISTWNVEQILNRKIWTHL